eukprot:2368183-Rhodomonas_salina.1
MPLHALACCLDSGLIDLTPLRGRLLNRITLLLDPNDSALARALPRSVVDAALHALRILAAEHEEVL